MLCNSHYDITPGNKFWTNWITWAAIHSSHIHPLRHYFVATQPTFSWTLDTRIGRKTTRCVTTYSNKCSASVLVAKNSESGYEQTHANMQLHSVNCQIFLALHSLRSRQLVPRGQ